MKCINLNSPTTQLLSFGKHNRLNCKPTTNHVFWVFSSNSMINKKQCGVNNNIASQVHTLNVDAFPASLTTLAIVAKPPNTSVLLLTSTLFIFLYIITNFVVPQIITKRFGLEESDDDEKPKR
ncbi:hypothetical protein RND81_09G045800 [Saponaria officinalis]|uniref:Transmembrane protein n=1 Tax=Saponaria officinalis TaxID=3572 RepID=A0AAW1IIT1_SAPOF